LLAYYCIINNETMTLNIYTQHVQVSWLSFRGGNVFWQFWV